ncbi:hypothetical protein [Streptomyces fodineus]|uniref:hypothetical protein n=1 Tax=Streptomyces fodineus TaxID=1904616 RepID=UPI00131D85D0|nr:hypothetical protein [Streptomyces fodineus]
MAAPRPAGPVADFWSELHRLVDKCGVSQREISEALGWSSTSSVSELLRGQRRKVPDWDVVRKIVGLCAEKGLEVRPAGMSLDLRFWKSRHAELERTVEATRRRVGRHPGPVGPPAPPLDAAACADMRVLGAVRLLIAGHMGPTTEADAVEALMTAPRGEPDPPAVLGDLLKDFPDRVRAACGAERAALIQAARVVLTAVAVMRTAHESTADVLIGHLTEGGHLPHTPPLAALGDRNQDAALQVVGDYAWLAIPLATSCPEFALGAGLPGVEPGDRSTGLAELGNLLSDFAGGHGPSPSQEALLRVPIAALDAPGPRLPGLEEGYITPRFRLAGGPPHRRSGIASDKWWAGQPLHDDIERFLAAHVLGLPALLAPLVVLGHPGAGKSLLTKLLTARLPVGEFRPLRVELRHTPAELDIQAQLEHALKRTTGREVGWPNWSEAEKGPVPVVLLDGFDELLQAGAQKLGTARPWGYLREVEDFQRREARQGRPLIVIVTSRTVVADRAEIPSASQVLRLEPFGEPEIERWLTVWNTTNADYFERHRLLPLTPEVLLPHRDLAAQPLLLLMLALYDAAGNALRLLENEGISSTELYDRLLGEFVGRQVAKEGPLPPAETAAAVDRELHRLSVIALSMFHRGAQAISGEQADRDLRALVAPDDSSGLLFGRFFFVHEALAVVTEERLRSYEFMHATFGEHLAARLIDRALRRLVEGLMPLDDGELYALLSFAPLTDRSQLVQNLRGMLAAWPAHHTRTSLAPALIDLFRAAQWDPEHRTLVRYAPVRRRRAYRDAVYEVNLVLIAVLAADEVYASELVGADADVRDTWRQHALEWKGQLSEESWAALTMALHPERCRRPDEDHRDLRLTTRPAPFAGHDFNWLRALPPPTAVRSLSDVVEHRLSASGTGDLIRRLSFAADLDVESLLHIAYPVLLQLPEACLPQVSVMTDGRAQSPVQPFLALVTRDVYAPEDLPQLYLDCLTGITRLPRAELGPYLEAVLRHLVDDAPALPDEELSSVLHSLAKTIVDLEVERTDAMSRALLACTREALHRRSPRLQPALDVIRTLLRRAAADPLQSLLAMTSLSDSTHSWRWSGFLLGEISARHFDELLEVLELPVVATTRPAALVGLLRLAVELGLTDWLSAHVPEVLGALPGTAFGLLRPSDLPHLRAALPPGAYADEFKRVEGAWRNPRPQSYRRPDRPSW